MTLTAVVPTIAMALLLAAACGGNDSPTTDAPIPGLSPEDEVVLVPATHEPETPDFEWTRAYRVGDLPAMNVGRPGPAFWEAAGHEPLPNFVCAGGGGGYSCSMLHDSRPVVGAETFGGPSVLAWSWIDVPNEAAAVQFSYDSGAVLWQRPLDGVVLFPHVGPDDQAGRCTCRFDALSVTGDVLATVDVDTGSYVSVP